MDILRAMETRHSVRRYTDKAIAPELVQALQEEIDTCNREGGLHIQLVLESPEAFGNFLAHYGMLKGVRNYIAMVGKDTADLQERVGYYGEHIVLKAQMLGLNTCWVGGTYSKRKIRVQADDGEKVVCVIAIGYGANQGRPHRNRSMDALYRVSGSMPEWFRRGMEAAMTAPTAINQQKFRFILQPDGSVLAEDLGGPYSQVDLGIVKYHFELGAGKDSFKWA